MWGLLSVTAAACVEQWGQWEASWRADGVPGNPLDIELSVRLTQGGESATARGFYDGNGQFKAQFMLPTVGIWTYSTASNLSTLHGARGSFEVVAPLAGSSTHGPVRVSAPHSTTFVHADGTRHHTVGTTVYSMFGGAGSLTFRTLHSLQG